MLFVLYKMSPFYTWNDKKPHSASKKNSFGVRLGFIVLFTSSELTSINMTLNQINYYHQWCSGAWRSVYNVNLSPNFLKWLIQTPVKTPCVMNDGMKEYSCIFRSRQNGPVVGLWIPELMQHCEVICSESKETNRKCSTLNKLSKFKPRICLKIIIIFFFKPCKYLDHSLQHMLQFPT